MATAVIKGTYGNKSRRANATITFDAAEIFERFIYNNVLYREVAVVTNTSTLQLAVTTELDDGTDVNVYDETYTATEDQPMWEFVMKALAQFQAAMPDARISVSQTSRATYRVDVKPIGETVDVAVLVTAVFTLV